MTWNLLNGGRDDRDRRRSELHEAVIVQLDPDVLLIQEARGFLEEDSRLLLECERAWHLRGFVGRAPETGQHTGVFIRPEYRALSFRADATHFHHGMSQLTVDVGASAPITFVSVHLSPVHPYARRIEAAHLAGFADPRASVVVGGDFNSPSPDDPAVDLTPLAPHFRVRYDDGGADADRTAVGILLDAGLVELRGDDAPTVPTACFPDVEFVPFRADHLLVSNALAGATTQVIVDEHAAAASDHYPVVTELTPP